jgi:hypothetical protein
MPVMVVDHAQADRLSRQLAGLGHDEVRAKSGLEGPDGSKTRDRTVPLEAPSPDEIVFEELLDPLSVAATGAYRR